VVTPPSKIREGKNKGVIMKVPTKLVSTIIEYVNVDMNFSNLNDKSKKKLIKILLELWLFIYNKQITNNECLNLQFYTDIDKNTLRNFNIQIEGVRWHYKQLLDILLFINVISTNGSYKVGSFYKGWRIETNFISGNFTEIELDIDKIFSNFSSKEYWLEKYPNQSSLIEDAYNASIDLDGYILWLNKNKGCEINPVYNKSTGKIEKRFLTEERIYNHLFLALKVNFGNLWFKLSNEGRFYSSISNLPNGSVNFIKLWGYDTCALDIRNCQPLLLSTMVSSKEYKEDCSNGLFYKKMAEDLGINEKEFKVQSYKYIFFGSNQLKSGSIYNSMEKLYGGLVSQINTIKREGGDNFLSKKLQEMESKIFVKAIGKLNIKKLLRHDEVLVMVKDKELMERHLRKEFEKKGLIIKIK
jgi:hypothetical protein